MLRRFAATIEQGSPVAIFSIGCAMVGLLFVADVLTGPDLAFSSLYLIPIALVAWGSTRRAAIGVAVLSALAWLIADLESGRSLPQTAVVLWNTVARLAVNVIIALLLSYLRRTLELTRQLADTDPLTGLANRRRFQVLIANEIARAQRYRRPFTLAYVDLDNFKQVNDRFGHDRGDRMLKSVGGVLGQDIRATDVAARLGGDEFVLLLAETGATEAGLVLGGLEARVMAALTALANGVPVTLSIGAVTFLSPPPTADAAIRMADELMLAVKATGKAGIEHRVVHEAPDYRDRTVFGDVGVLHAAVS